MPPYNYDDIPKPPTEERLTSSRNLDQLTQREILNLLNEHDEIAVRSVRDAIPEIDFLLKETKIRFEDGGNVHYFGAGTSGRLGYLDAAELIPTFNVAPGRFQAHIAGGHHAVTDAVEGAEDSSHGGKKAAENVSDKDVVIGLTASGNTPYVFGAMKRARENGAFTVLVSSNPRAKISEVVDKHILLNTGPEVITGSTRLKAGTAEKLFLNSFSTTLFISLGYTLSNLMVSLVATNKKLHRRTLSILRELTGLDDSTAVRHLDACDGDLQLALLSNLRAVSPMEARRILRDVSGNLRAALDYRNENEL